MDDFDTEDRDWRLLEDELGALRWRIRRLMVLGYEMLEAAYLAVSGVDVNELETLIASGCPPRTALRIAA
jgi:hypothetical protein